MERACKFLKEAGVYYLATVEDDNTEVLYFEKAVATISSFTEAPKVIEF